MKAIRKITIFIILLCMSLFLGLAITINNNATVKADSQSELVVESFTMVDGVSVRATEPNGIRFMIEISSTEYLNIIEKYGETNVEFGARIARVSDANIAELETNIEALKNGGTEVKRTRWDSELNPTNSSTTYRYNVAIVDFEDKNLNKNYIAIGYIKVDGDVKWTDDVVIRTPIQVASEHISTFSEINKTDAEQQFVLQCVDKVMSAKDTFAFKDSQIEIKCLEEVKPVVLIDGVEVTAEYTVASNDVAVVENGFVKGVSTGDTTITATIPGYDNNYTCTASLSVVKGEVTPLIKSDGALSFDTAEDAKVTVKVDDVSIGEYKSDEINIVDYLLDNNTITQATTYKISIENDNVAGEITHTLSPITNDNFKSTLGGVTVSNCASTHYFLTEDIIINPWVSDSDKGDFTYLQGSAYSVFWNMYANLDGRGHKISYSVNSERVQLTGLIGQLFGVWSNVHFEITLKNTDNRALFSYYTKAGSGIINCYFDVESDTSESTTIFNQTDGTNIGESVVIKDCIFNINNKNENVYPYYGNAFANYALISESESELVLSLSGGYLYGSTEAYHYSCVSDFISGQNGKKYCSATGTSIYQTSGESVSEVIYSSWDGWSIENGEISLCGRVVYNGQKTQVDASIDGNILNLGTNGQFTNVYATVNNGTEQLIAQDVMHTFDIGAYSVEQGWATLEGTEVSIRIDSKNYTSSLTQIFKKADASVVIDNNGIVTFDVGEETANLYVDGTKVDGATSGFDLTDWAFSNELSGDKEYTVRVDSDSYVGSATKLYKALNDNNFVETLNEYNSIEYSNIYFYLTGNIALEGRTGSEANKLGDMTTSVTDGSLSGNFVFENMYASLDGRGYTISYTFADGNANKMNGLVYNYCGTWQNVVFDINVTSYASNCGAVFMRKVTGGSLINCYLDVDIASGTGGAPIIGETFGGVINNCIVDIAINNTSLVARFIGNAKTGCEIKNCVFISGNKFDIINYINSSSTTTIYAYTSCDSFISGVGTIYNMTGKVGNFSNNSSWGVEHGVSGTELTVYSDWDAVWSINYTTGISLLGKQIV